MRKQVILVGARDYRTAGEIAKLAGFKRNEIKYVSKYKHFMGHRDAILLLDGTGDYSFWKGKDPFDLDLSRMEAEGRFTTVIIPRAQT
jgi:hypothetical protein